MFTRCVHCNTVFSVSAAALRVGRGRVRCGACLEEFEALATLSEDLPGAANRPAEPPPDPPPGVPPGASLDDTLDLHGPDADPPEELAVAISLPTRSAPVRVPVLDSPPQATVATGGEVPEVLREDLARMETVHRDRWRTVAWTSATALLVLALLVQYAWFRPGDLVKRYPQAQAWVERFCARAGCVLPERRRPDRVRVVARDVRVHPRYEGALLIAATLVNGAAAPQPFPRLEFTLFNVNGQAIASRMFDPGEYLGGAADPRDEMRPEQPVQIALEMIAPEQAAVSFEFRFL